MTSRPDRRVVAIVLPELLCELAGSRPSASQKLGKDFPLGVVLVDPDGVKEPAESTALLSAVNARARRYGVRAGQTVIEARAFVGQLVVREISRTRVNEVLGQIAEVALAFGPTAGIEPPDTIWVDITGAAHLAGGEKEIASELAGRVRSMGHVARAAISSGPRFAQAFARWSSPVFGEEFARVIPHEETCRRFAELPVLALPLDAERVAFLARLGIHTVGQLAELPRASAASRLGEQASVVLDMALGHDSTIISAYTKACVPTEENTWDEPLAGVEPLLFVLRGLVSRLGARLAGRGEATTLIHLVIEHDRSVSRLNGIKPQTTLPFELAVPLHRPEELFRVLSSRLQKLRLEAPTIGLRLEARGVTRALGLQLHLGDGNTTGSGEKGPDSLPVLLAEIAADIGKSHLGVLEIVNAHRPEAQSRLVSVPASSLLGKESGSRKKNSFPATRAGLPTRLLPKPVPMETALRVGALLSIEHELYTIESIEFSHRLDSVEWWAEATSRDYLRVWLSGAHGGLEAWVYVNRDTGTRFLQAICD